MGGMRLGFTLPPVGRLRANVALTGGRHMTAPSRMSPSCGPESETRVAPRSTRLQEACTSSAAMDLLTLGAGGRFSVRSTGLESPWIPEEK